MADVIVPLATVWKSQAVVLLRNGHTTTDLLAIFAEAVEQVEAEREQEAEAEAERLAQ